MFFLAAAVNIVTNIVYIIFGSAEEQPFNHPQPKDTYNTGNTYLVFFPFETRKFCAGEIQNDNLFFLIFFPFFMHEPMGTWYSSSERS